MKRGPLPLLLRRRDIPYTRLLIWFRGGSSLEEEQELGWAHLVEHLLFKLRHEGQTIAEFIEATGGVTNAFTSHDALVVEATVRNEDTARTMRFLGEVLSRPLTTIGRRDFEEERSVVLEELRLYDDEPNERLFVEVMRNRYPEHPYGREIIGTAPSLKQADLAALERFLRKKLSHDPFVVIAGGTGEPQTLALPLCPAPRAPRLGSRPTRQRFVISHGQQKNYLLAAWRLDTCDAARLAALRLLHTIAYDMEGSRFRDRLVYETNTFDSLSMSIINGVRGISFVQNAVYEPTRSMYRLKRWSAAWEQLSFTQDEVARAREVILSDECFASEGIGSLAETTGMSWLMFGDPFRLERDIFWHISHLTAHDLYTFKQEHLSLEQAVIGLSSPVRHPAAFPPPPDRPRPSIHSSGAVPTIIVKKGCRVLLRASHHAPFVSLYALKRSGVFADPPGRGGAFRLMLETLATTAKGLSREKTDEFLDRFGIALEPVFGNNTGGLRLTARDTFLPESLDILKRILANPLREEDFVREKELTLSRLSLKRESPVALLKEKIHETLFAGTPYDHPPEGTASSVAAVTFADMRHIRREFFERDRWSLGIAGAVGRSFAEETATVFPVGSRPPLEIRCRSTVPLGDRTVFVTIPGRHQRHIVRLFRAPGVRSRSFEVMRLIEQALLGQRSPLFQRLREEEGLVYSFDVWGMGGLTEGYAAIYAATSPEKAETVMRRIEETIVDIRNGALADPYLAEVKNAALFEHARSSVHNEHHAFNLALEDALRLPFGAYLRQPTAIQAITRDDIVSCAERYLTHGLWLVSREDDHGEKQ